ncbi:MAG TPA: class II aldolase/adducin family protein [Pyrinomonadaceae bacterium]|nr:class II aldolase/adducin family protein [Pyrinomonadaceae bacterium]
MRAEATPNEEAIKFDICCAARLLYRQGLSVANAGHLSVAVAPDRMLVNHFGPSFATLRPENVVAVDFSGRVLEGAAYVNDTIRLHGIIHRENPRATAVAHTHPPSVVTYSAFRLVPEVYDQESCLLVDDVGLVDDDYEGLAAEEERVMPIADALRERPAVILPNHGAITTGDNIQVAFLRMVLLEEMTRRNLSVAEAARNLGREPVPIAPEAARRAKAEIARIPVLPLLWKDFLTRLRASDPDLFEGRDGD